MEEGRQTPSMWMQFAQMGSRGMASVFRGLQWEGNGVGLIEGDHDSDLLGPGAIESEFLHVERIDGGSVILFRGVESDRVLGFFNEIQRYREAVLFNHLLSPPFSTNFLIHFGLKVR